MSRRAGTKVGWSRRRRISETYQSRECTVTDLRFGNYQVIKRLAVGGMGEIFLARQSGVAGFDRLAIIKTLLPDLTADEDAVGAFLDEARIAATLNHPNVVQIYEVGESSGTYFIAMEYIHGESLAGLMRAMGGQDGFPPPVVGRIGRDAAAGLDYAHRATDPQGNALHIVHRDISPQNIMVRDDGVVKVVDFGIARATNRETRTRTGMVKGKLQYMPPEQLHDQPLDGRADQFALGIVLWELLARRRLFQGANDFLTIQKIGTEPILPPSSYQPDIPHALEETVMRMLEREPEDRFQTCAQVVDALEHSGLDVEGTTGQRALAGIVSMWVGEDLEARTDDLTPSGDRPHHHATPSSAPLGEPPIVDTRATSRRPLVLGALGVLAGAIAAGIWLASVLEPPGPQPAAPEPPPREITRAPDTQMAQPTRGWLEIRSVPDGATVRRGRRVLGTTPLRVEDLEVDGEHLLTVEKRGFVTVSVPATLRAGETEKITVPLVEAPSKGGRRGRKRSREPPDPGTATTGFLTLRTTPWTKVSIDGKPSGTTPLYRLELKAGEHRLHLVNEAEGIDVTRQITIPPDDALKMRLTLP